MNGKPITPRQFAEEMVSKAAHDPGCERKAMLFYLADMGCYLRYVGIRSEARCMVLELVKDSEASAVCCIKY